MKGKIGGFILHVAIVGGCASTISLLGSAIENGAAFAGNEPPPKNQPPKPKAPAPVPQHEAAPVRPAQQPNRESFQQAHPIRSEVLGRDANLNNRINQNRGDLNGQYGRLESENNAIRRQEQMDAARNGGHLTGQEDRQLNREENGVSRQIGRDNYGAGDAQFQENHPLRSEVLGRDANLNNRIDANVGNLGGQYGQLQGENNAIQRQEQIDAARNGGHLTGQEYRQLNGEQNNLSRQIIQARRPAVPPPLPANPVPLQQAAPAPVIGGQGVQVSAAQQAQAALAYQKMQANLYPVSLAQAPPNFQQTASSQAANYLNNSPAYVGGQPISINPSNTYYNVVPQSNYPPWWGSFAPQPGWGWSNGFVLGSIINAGLGWLRGGWPHYYGPPPNGFIYPPGFVPTPWVYNPFLNQWRQPGQMAWTPMPPPPDYVMPITVQAIEPIQVMVEGLGGPVMQTVNQLVMYNAYYYPQMGRWGYQNRNGYFVWLNTPLPVSS
jgi:hypothetical protein